MSAAVLLYVSGFLHGLVLVSVPALAPQLRAELDLGDAAWGAAFLPQMAGSFAGSLASGALARRLGLRVLLASSLVLAALAEAALLASPALGYGALLLATGTVGLAFGISAAPLNAGPPALFPLHLDASVAASHVAMGLGLTAGPALVALAGWRLPAVLLVLGLVLAAVAATTALPSVSLGAVRRGRLASEPGLWMLLAVGVLYGCAESTFSNWVVVYLVEEKGLGAADAALALAAFWGAMTAGRGASIGLLWRVSSARVVGLFPALMLLALLAIPLARTRAGALGMFALAGLACSAFVPMGLALAVRRFPEDGAAVAAAFIAAVGLGLGIGALVAGLLRDGRTLAEVYHLAAAYPALMLALLAVLRARGDLRG